MDMQTLRAETQKHGRVPVDRDAFSAIATSLFGAAQAHGGASSVAAHVSANHAAPSVPNSAFLTVGEAPDGFGKQVIWDPADTALALLVFISAADPLGVMISGVNTTDTIECISATGVASFAEETKNEGVSSFIGIVAAGASAAATAFGQPELVPVISAASSFAQDRFKAKLVKTKRRDPFGQDPGTGLRARQEGGVLISLPGAGQAFYSGDSDHKDRWIKEPGIRQSANYPNHVPVAFTHFWPMAMTRSLRAALATS